VRVDPAGGGTDAPPFSVEHGGRVVNFAIQRHAFAAVDRLPAAAGVSIYSEDLGEGIAAPAASALPARGRLEFLAAFVRRLVPEGDGLLLVTESDVPAGAGLGGSGALGVAIVAALDRAYGGRRSPEGVAALANDIERRDLGYPGGNQDSYGAALGGVNDLEYLKGGGTIARRVPLSGEMRLAIEHHSLLIYTSEAHVSGNIHRDIKASYARPDSPTVAAMVELRQAAARMAAALAGGDLAGYLDAMNASCRNLYRLHPSCDSDAHRRCLADLGDAVLGAKTCGAGGGGFLLVHVRPGRRRECRVRAERLGAMVWPVAIDFDGVASWSAPPLPRAEIERYRALAAEATR
jgi:D-glycero-alpha-D-manno-heptose-7-phosphate kinase